VSVAKRIDPVIECLPEENMAKQSFKDECDINNIVRQLMGGRMELPTLPPEFEDATVIASLEDSLQTAAHLQSYFESLPADMRERYRNDALVFAAGITAEEHREDARQLGLFVDPPADQVAQVEPPVTPA